VELCIRDLKAGVGLRHCPSGKFNANAAWLVLATLAHNLLRWIAQIGLGTRQELVVAKTLRRTLLRPARPDHALRQAMDAASARRLAVGGVVCAGPCAAALCGPRHLTPLLRLVPSRSPQAGCHAVLIMPPAHPQPLQTRPRALSPPRIPASVDPG
jgi:hypothetical protein